MEKFQAYLESIRLANHSPRKHQRLETDNMELRGQATVVAKDSLRYRDP